jgi:hypothetical protein
MPHTFARDRFDSWHATKRPDDCLSVEQLHTVLHFLDILYTECYMAIEIRQDSALVTMENRLSLQERINSLLDKKLEGMRQETARALEQITAKTDSALVTMENRLSLQERTMMASAIQTRVDPINRSYEALVALHRHLTSLLKERKKLARSSSPDLKELSDLDEQIGLEQDNIAKAKHKLCQRHAALVGDAQRLNIPLHDLVELDFQDGPA